MKCFDIVVIGAGVVGAAIARELSKYKLKIALIDMANDVCEGISKANSGVIHAGFNVKPGSMKARLNREGLDLLPKVAAELGVKYKICKKLVVAKDDIEKVYIEKLYGQGLKNDTPGLSIIKELDIKRLAPGIQGRTALFSERTGIITPFHFTIALAENAHKNGVDVILSREITNISKDSSGKYLLFSSNDIVCKTRWIINSAGLYSDELMSLLERCPHTIRPCRGEYYIMDKSASNLLELAVYPVPPTDGSGLGVHLTPTMNGNILIGPSADYIDDKFDISNTKTVMDQLKKEALELMPQLKDFQFIKNFSGIRPKLFEPNDRIKFDDFYIAESEKNKRFINLVGIESPGLTSSPAIAKYITEYIIGNKEELVLKNDFDPVWDNYLRVADMPFDEIDKLITKNSDFGQVVCRCEYITKGEIIKALRNPLGAMSLNSIKKRTHSLSGRCQGGFCTSRIIKLLKEEFGLTENEIIRGSNSSYMLTERDYEKT